MAKSKWLTLGCVLAAVVLGALVGAGAWELVLIALVPVAIALGSRWPVLDFLALLALATELLGVASGASSFRLGGIVDAVVAAVLLCCLFIARGPLRPTWARLGRSERAVVAVLVAVVCISVARAIGTSVEYGIQPLLTIAAARRYLLFVIPVGVMVLSGRMVKPSRLVDVFLAVAVAYSTVVLLSWASGGIGLVQGFRVVAGEEGARAYPVAGWVSLGGAAVAFARISVRGNLAPRLAALVTAAVCSAAVISTGSRAAFLALAVSAVVIFVLKPASSDARVGRRLSMAVAAVLVVLSLLYGFSALGFGGRLGEMSQEIIGQSGTFGVRITESQFRLAMVARSPIVGVGFVPFAVSGSVTQGYGGITHLETVDSGLVTLLVNFGAIGVLWLLALVLAVGLAYRWRAGSGRPVVLWRACVGYIIGGLVTVATQGHFTMSQGIAATMLMIGLALGESVGSAADVATGGE